MLSPFLKRLIFVRQFFMMDGKIEILGQKQILLPLTITSVLSNEDSYVLISKSVKDNMLNYSKKMGTLPGGMIKAVQDVYEIMGLGKMQIIKLDPDNKVAILRILNIDSKISFLIEGVLGGFLLYLTKI